MGYFNVNLFFIKLKSIFNEFKSSEKGVTATEYGLIAVAVAAMIVVVFYNQGGFIDALKSKFSQLATKVGSATVQ